MVRINVIFSEDILEEIDVIAKQERKSRSLILREAAEKVIEERRRKAEELRRRARREAAFEAMDRLKKKSGAWDGVSEVRKWRDASK
ncbi:MAG: ribbon-helix-helix protein, CopG family [Deltaproteobacteria bacterium]|nr:ribbon-helix-helix protein, CopG family [Deltaproteobacteria bacterium]